MTENAEKQTLQLLADQNLFVSLTRFPKQYGRRAGVAMHWPTRLRTKSNTRPGRPKPGSMST